MKPPVGAITERRTLMKLVAKAKETPVKVFLVWFTSKKWTITVIEFTDRSQVRGDAIYEVIVHNFPSSSCSFSPCSKDREFVQNYWYFRNYWLAHGYMRRIQAKCPDASY